MNIQIKLSDDFIEEGQLIESLRKSIIFDITQSIKATVKDQVEKEIAQVLRDSIAETVEQAAQETMSEFIETGIITVSGKQILAKDHLKNIFQGSTGWGNPSKQIELLAEKWAKELKSKYDGAFVTHLVQKINLAGMLKPEVATLLLADMPHI